MTRRKDFKAATTYTGQKLKGIVDVSFKIDGVRILNRENGLVTRNDKIPPGLDGALTDRAKAKVKMFGDCEVYLGDFLETNSMLSRDNPVLSSITDDNIFPLDYTSKEKEHAYDPRLHYLDITDPTPDQIESYLQDALNGGYEGLVLRTAKHWYRVKPTSTADVYVTGWFEQLDKSKTPKGLLGGFDTAYGKITAFTDEDRRKLWEDPGQYVGKLIEVRYKERYHTGKFRYAVKFNHFRTDKNEERFDTEPPAK